MPRRGYKQKPEHRTKHLEKIQGQGNGNFGGEWHGPKGLGGRKEYLSTEQKKLNRMRYELKRRYGISPEELEQLIQLQGGTCQICSAINCRLVIDHDHKTGLVRGLLCYSCNTGLGFFRDSEEALLNAAEYLRNYKGRTRPSISR